MKNHGKSAAKAAMAEAMRSMPGVEEYFHAQATAPHPEREAYSKILAAKQRAGMSFIVDDVQPRDQILATGPHEGGGAEMIVRKADGVVVLLMPQLPQVRNTPQGPKQVKTAAPAELPLVKRTIARPIQQNINRMLGEPPLPALLLFQGRFGTAARELSLG